MLSFLKPCYAEDRNIIRDTVFGLASSCYNPSYSRGSTFKANPGKKLARPHFNKLAGLGGS
jgi:hypothetical protein